MRSEQLSYECFRHCHVDWFGKHNINYGILGTISSFSSCKVAITLLISLVLLVIWKKLLTTSNHPSVRLSMVLSSVDRLGSKLKAVWDPRSWNACQYCHQNEYKIFLLLAWMLWVTAGKYRPKPLHQFLACFIFQNFATILLLNDILYLNAKFSNHESLIIKASKMHFSTLCTSKCFSCF